MADVPDDTGGNAWFARAMWAEAPDQKKADLRRRRRTRDRDHEAMVPEDWLDVTEGGDVAVHFDVAADHEWWMAYDQDGEYPGDLDGPWHLWTTYPGGAWEHTALPEGILVHHLEELYWIHNDNRESDIRRSNVVALEDAPRMVRERLNGN